MAHESLTILQGKQKFLDKPEIKTQKFQPKKKLVLASLGEPSGFFGPLLALVSGLLVAVPIVYFLLWLLKLSYQ